MDRTAYLIWERCEPCEDPCHVRPSAAVPSPRLLLSASRDRQRRRRRWRRRRREPHLWVSLLLWRLGLTYLSPVYHDIMCLDRPLTTSLNSQRPARRRRRRSANDEALFTWNSSRQLRWREVGDLVHEEKSRLT